MTPDSPPPYLVTDRFHVDRAGEAVVAGGESVRLNHRSYQVLLALMSRPRALVSKRELFKQVWGTLDVSDAVLTTAIKEIRQALGDDARAPWAIATVHARGYRFLLDVHQSDEPGDEPDAATPVAPPSGALHVSRSLRGTPRAWWAAAAATLAVLLAVLLAVVLGRGPEPDAGGQAQAQAEPVPDSIAVLPFDDFSSQGGQAWFGHGLAEEILNSLAQSRELRVAARTSSFRYAGGDKDIRDIGRELAVTHVMEGSIRREAELLRVTAQLIRTDDGLHVWSRTYDLPVDARNALSLQRDIAEEVLAMVSAGPLKPPPQAMAVPMDLAVYERYLRGRELVMQRQPQSVPQGLDELQAVVRLAPDFAPGHAWLAQAKLLSVSYAGRPVVEAITAAELHLRTALRLDPEGVHTLLAAALLETFRRDVDAALALADRAVAAHPNSVPALRRRGVILLLKGRHQEAHRDFLAVRERDPLSAISLAHLSDSHLIRNEPDSALAAARDGVRWNPDDAVAHGNLGRVLGEVGDYADAVRHLERSVELNPAARLSTLALASLYWRLGLEARLPAADEASYWTGRAAAAFSSGDRERGLRLAETFETGFTGSFVGLQFIHWYGDEERVYAPALRLVARDRLAETGLAGSYRPGAIPALLALERQGDPQAGAVRANLQALFADHRPGHFLVARDVYGAAAWRMVNGDADAAIAWLAHARDQGLVFRELQLDPIWDPLRSQPAFQAIATAMDQRAASIRRALG